MRASWSMVLACLVSLPPLPAGAEWLHRARDVGGTYVGAAESSAGLAFACAAYAPGARPDPGDPRAAPTPPDVVRLILSPALLPPPDNRAALRDDVVLNAGATGYRLPALRYDRVTGWWEVALNAADQLFAAIAAERSISLQAGGTAQAIDATGFGSVYRSFVATCRQRFERRGQPWSVAVPEWPHGQAAAAIGMAAAAEADIGKGCAGSYQASPGHLTLAEIDGDGAEDAVLDWREVTCGSGAARPFCGAAACAVDVYLSGLYATLGTPAHLLGVGQRVVPLSNGNAGVAVGRAGCFDADCETVFYWNGDALVALQDAVR